MAALTFAQQFLNNLFEGILTGRLAEHVTIQEVRRLLAKVKRIFRKQPMMLQINAPVVICGDLHGQFNDVIRMFSHEGFPNTRSYLFLGDYIDRGNQSVELILFMFACKIRYPRNFYMLRGNHETASINNVYGFRQALMDVYASAELYHAFQGAFDWMPLSAIVSERILCMHGGLSQVLYGAPNIDVLNTIQRPLTDAQITPKDNQLATDLLWADPDVRVQLFGVNHRGISSTFGQQVINTVKRKFGLDLIVRGHQVVMDGYEFFNDDLHSGLVTLFTAPHYCGVYNNAGGIMRVSPNLAISFKVYLPDYLNQHNNHQGG